MNASPAELVSTLLTPRLPPPLPL